MIICACSKCKYVDLMDENSNAKCLRCGGDYVSLGVSSSQWNKLSDNEMKSLIDSSVSEAGAHDNSLYAAVYNPVSKPAWEVNSDFSDSSEYTSAGINEGESLNPQDSDSDIIQDFQNSNNPSNNAIIDFPSNDVGEDYSSNEDTEPALPEMKPTVSKNSKVKKTAPSSTQTYSRRKDVSSITPVASTPKEEKEKKASEDKPKKNILLIVLLSILGIAVVGGIIFGVNMLLNSDSDIFSSITGLFSKDEAVEQSIDEEEAYIEEDYIEEPIAEEVIEEESVEEVVPEEPVKSCEELEQEIKDEYKKKVDERDYDKIFALCNEAIALNSGYAYVCLAIELKDGRNITQDYDKALEYAQASVDSGFSDGYHILSGFYADGQGVPVDPAKAIEIAQKGASEGSFICNAVLGNYYSGYPGFEDYADEKLMFENYITYAENTDPEDVNASYYSGVAQCYLNGTGVEKDEAKGVEWLTKASDKDVASAQHTLGTFYYSGKCGVEQNYKTAVELWIKSANNGYQTAMLEMFNVYYSGLEDAGVSLDYAKALEYAEMIINSDVDLSKHTDWSIYEKAGLAAGHIDDWTKARQYLEKSVENNEDAAENAKKNLNWMDENGK